MESRHGNATLTGRTKSSPLPQDYLKMVEEVFTTNFNAGLKELAKIKPGPSFEAHGAVFPNEVVLSVSLVHPGQLAATTAYASSDFDPKASAPTIQDLLASCVDALGSMFDRLLKPDVLKQLAGESLSEFTDIPFQWTVMKVENRQIHVKIDKSNPRLDEMADEWLTKNDPEALEHEKREQEETKKLFVTGPKSRGDSGNSGTVH